MAPDVSFDKEEYAKTVNTLLLLGFSFKYDTDIFDPNKRDALQCPCKLTDFSFTNSYEIEGAVLITTALLFWYSFHKYYQIKSLMAVSRKDFLDYNKITAKLAKSDDESSSESEDDEDDKPKTGHRLRESEKKELRDAKRMEKRREMKEQLDELSKLIRRNMVGSLAFYNHIRTYFVLGIICMMFEAVSFNSLSSIPGMFMIIALLSLYEIR